MKHKILFAGIDGSGKSTCLDLLISRLDSYYSIIKIDIFGHYRFFKGEKRSVFNHRYYKIMENLRTISKKHNLYRAFLIINFIYKLVLTKIIEILNKCDLLMYSTDLFLHPAVYVTYYFPFTRKVKASFRFYIFNILFWSKRNFTIIYLDTNPEVAMARIRRRGSEIDAHEKIEVLKKLKQEFDNIIGIASRNGFEVISIKTDDKNLEEVTDEIQAILGEKISIGQ